MRTKLGLVAGLCAVLAGWGGGARLGAAELPIRTIILYKHGIGYFQRSGQLGANDSAQLDFKAEEMNDVLKSLTIQQAGGGKVAGLRYDSSDPLDKKLEEFPFRIGPGQPLTAILDQLKGAAVELKSGSETIRGTLVSGRTVAGTDQRPPSEQITLLADSGEFRNIDLSAVASLRFQDPTLQTQFAEYLKMLHAARSKEKRSLYIDSAGGAAREIIASYMVPMPVWKSSYRLIFDPKAAAGAQPTLEGWAIVDNTTGDDWTNVQLSLVSGRPISFISQLYEPRYIMRPTAQLPGEEALAPVVYGGAIDEMKDQAAVVGFAEPGILRGSIRDSSGAVIAGARVSIRNFGTGLSRSTTSNSIGEFQVAGLPNGTYEVRAESSGFQSVTSQVNLTPAQGASLNLTLEVGSVTESVMVQAAPAMAKRMAVGGMAEFERAPAAPSAIAAAATGQDLGELFEYSFANPVTVKKSESAMLPFLQDKVTARKLLVYSDLSSQNPLNSVEITNSTGKTLDGGPITVYDAGAYAGEALVETLKKDDKRLISYGVDLGTRITAAFDSAAQVVREIHFQRGLFTTKVAADETRTYTIHNVDQEAKTLIIEHPVRSEYKVLNQKPVETTATAYRFEVKLGAGATEKFPVIEERILENSMAISSVTPDVIATYVQNKNISDAARAQLQQILDLKRQIAANDGEIQRTQAAINTVVQDQSRIRENINSLNRVAGQEQQVQNYSRQLAAQEAQLATQRDQLAQLQSKKTTLEGQLNSLIEKMSF